MSSKRDWETRKYELIRALFEDSSSEEKDIANEKAVTGEQAMADKESVTVEEVTSDEEAVTKDDSDKESGRNCESPLSFENVHGVSFPAHNTDAAGPSTSRSLSESCRLVTTQAGVHRQSRTVIDSSDSTSVEYDRSSEEDQNQEKWAEESKEERKRTPRHSSLRVFPLKRTSVEDRRREVCIAPRRVIDHYSDSDSDSDTYIMSPRLQRVRTRKRKASSAKEAQDGQPQWYSDVTTSERKRK